MDTEFGVATQRSIRLDEIEVDDYELGGADVSVSGAVSNRRMAKSGSNGGGEV